MNILPLIFTFLVIFSCIALTFFKEMKSYVLMESSCDGFYRTERVVSNAIIRKAYHKISGESLNKKSSTPSQKQKNVEYLSKRNFFPPYDNSKFHLAPLIVHQGELHLHPLYEYLAQFLRLLYKEKLKPGTEYHLIDAMIKKARKQETEVLADLHPDDPALKQVFYKLLKGTNQYSQENGIPPLGDFISLSKSEHAAFFSFASPVLLEAFFGEEIALAVLAEEKKKWETDGKYFFFSKEELQALITKNPAHASQFSILESYFNYSKQPSPRDQIAGKDIKTGIRVEKSL